MDIPPIFAAQYLEYFDPIQHSPQAVSQHLEAVFARLPLKVLCIGWDLPPAIAEACATEAARHGAALYRWHPLLTGNSRFAPPRPWRTLNANGGTVPGYRRLPEFTFMCPNHPAVQAAALESVHASLSSGIYQGIFLDRIRLPSPAANPLRDLACFCPFCIQAAAATGLDLEAVRIEIKRLAQTTDGRLVLVRVLFAQRHQADETDSLLASFFRFRQRSITHLVELAAGQARQMGCLVGLDTFSSTLSFMVGQDLPALAAVCDWAKPMSYAHALGPSGLPFELLGLARWLAAGGCTETEALGLLSQACQVPLPDSLRELQGHGVHPAVLADETHLAVASGLPVVLAGMALVELEGLNQVPPDLFAAEVLAYRQGGAAGLMLAWDLWHIPLSRLEAIASIWS